MVPKSRKFCIEKVFPSTFRKFYDLLGFLPTDTNTSLANPNVKFLAPLLFTIIFFKQD